MQFIGIIAEYNPFHCGHVWQLRELRRRYPDIDGIIVAMSGSFTQRGTPCIMDKWRRARHAVAGGADLVLELPFVFACRSDQAGTTFIPFLHTVLTEQYGVFES